MSVPECSHPRCRQPGGVYIGINDAGEDGWVCEKHLQYCSITEDDTWRLHHHIADAREAQAREKWSLA